MGGNSSKTQPETYTAIATFLADSEDQLTVHASEVVNVVQQTTSGWWLVETKNGKGWIPSAYLESENSKNAEKTIKFPPGKEENYMVIKRYEKAFDDELTLTPGTTVKVMEKTMDGWWLMRYNGKVGRAPAICLKRLSANKSQKNKERDKMNKETPITIKTKITSQIDIEKNKANGNHSSQDVKNKHAISKSEHLCCKQSGTEVLTKLDAKRAHKASIIKERTNSIGWNYEEISSDESSAEEYEAYCDALSEPEAEEYEEVESNPEEYEEVESNPEEYEEIFSSPVETSDFEKENSKENNNLTFDPIKSGVKPKDVKRIISEDYDAHDDEDGENYDDVLILNKSIKSTKIPRIKSLHIPAPPRKQSIKLKAPKSSVNQTPPTNSYKSVADFKDNGTSLSFKKGDVFELIQKNFDGWWFVKFADVDISGWVPSSYLVKNKPKEKHLDNNHHENEVLSEPNTDYLHPAVIESHLSDNSNGYEYTKTIDKVLLNGSITGFNNLTVPQFTSEEMNEKNNSYPIHLARSPFKGSDDNHTNLEQGESVVVYDKSNKSWWYVKTKHGKGFVPSHYLKSSPNVQNSSNVSDHPDTKHKPLPNEKKSSDPPPIPRRHPMDDSPQSFPPPIPKRIPSDSSSKDALNSNNDNSFPRKPPNVLPKPLMNKKTIETNKSKTAIESSSDEDDSIYTSPLKSVQITRQKFTQRKH